LLFIDSDVLIREDTIARVVAHFSSRPDLSALFGSYDRSPAAPNFLSQYKNLIHHFVHQQSNPDAVTFWAGCGAVRRDVFEGLGGFDEVRYKKPCIEDIELGYRLKRIGLDIFLDKELQVKHLKEWRIGSLIRADIFSRAVPWTRLILEREGMISDLNLQASQRISAGLVGLMAAGLAFSLLDLRLILLSFSLLTAVMVINRKLLMFFASQRGFLFAAGAFVMQLFYYFYSGTTFVLLYLMDRVQRRRRGARSLGGVMRGDKEEWKNATTSK
jgi:GT2 family glycosyltransferase